MRIASLDPADLRSCTVNVAGPAALLVAKLHKLGERTQTPDRLLDKDAHDIYRLLVAVPTNNLAAALGRLQSDALAGEVTMRAFELLDQLFARGPDSQGSMMAGRAEQQIGDPPAVAASSSVLAADLLAARRLPDRPDA